MTNKIANAIESVLIGSGVVVSLTDIQNILSIVLLCIDVAWILFRCGYSIYKKVKEKRYEEIEQDIKDASEQLHDIEEHLNDKSDGDK